MFNDLFFLCLGMFFLIKGADWFVDGASKMAKLFKVPSFIIGLTIVSLGTSAPELAVSVAAASNGQSSLSYGNVLGSNLFNTLVVLGLSCVIAPFIIKKSDMKFEVILLLLISLLLLFFTNGTSPNFLSRIEGIIFVFVFILFTIILVYKAIIKNKKENVKSEEKKEKFNFKKFIIDLVFLSIGLVGIIYGGEFVTKHATNIAKTIGMSEIMVGLTITSIGTSLPELITSVVAAKKKGKRYSYR